MAGYRCAVGETLGQCGGFVAKYMGDGVLAYFGYPRAHEEDAEQAMRAALAIVGAVHELDLPEQLHVRIGIATGLAVVGDLIGAGAAQERGVVGETPNLAARLQALADQMASSSPRRRGTISAACSNFAISGRGSFVASPTAFGLGRC
jgi:class 3 adenylate cyclase